MQVSERFNHYRELEKYRGRTLIVFISGARLKMRHDSIAWFIDQIEAIPSDTRSLDLLVASRGGDLTTAWQIVSLIRERVDHMSVLIPGPALSAATLVVLGADEIAMHPNAYLGPVDPRIGVRRLGRET